MEQPNPLLGQHLPKLRGDGRPPHPDWLPAQRRGTTPQMIGRYPDFDVFDARHSWDPATARVIDERMKARYGDPTSFFDDAQAASARAFADAVMAQDRDPKVPVVEMIDQRLQAGKLDGYQYAGMPDDRDTWKLVLSGLDDEARDRYGRDSLADCPAGEVEEIVGRFAAGDLRGGVWEQLAVGKAWSVCTRMIVSAFYAHPWAWNEIGFGGPAYPRGYMRLGPLSVREPYEKPGIAEVDPVERYGKSGE